MDEWDDGSEERKPVCTDDEVNQWSGKAIAAAIEVHRRLGPGFLESVYEEAMCIEFALRGIPFVRQVPVAVSYKGHKVGTGKMDILVANCLVLELKTIEDFAPIHTAQIISYLKASGHRVGLLINFNVSVLKNGLKRIAL